MWNELENTQDITVFMKSIYYFHDSCIKEIHYESGAYVNENLAMRPVNEQRKLHVIIQRQFPDIPMLELEFAGLHRLQLIPAADDYTCEILDATMLMEDNRIYWCDCGGLTAEDMDIYDGTVICAAKCRWRAVKDHMGQAAFYRPIG